MKIAGKTTEDILCLSGIFALYGTYGIPLEIILDVCRDRGYVVAWDEFFLFLTMTLT